MKVINDKEVELVKLSISEGIDTITSRLHIDFKIKHSDFTVHQNYRLNQIELLLYTLFAEIVEDHGSLQSEYDQKTII
jgi:hypothetical protein